MINVGGGGMHSHMQGLASTSQGWLGIYGSKVVSVTALFIRFGLIMADEGPGKPT